MTGDSQIAFDFKNGLPRTINFKATLTLARGNASHRLPLTVSYTLLEGKDRERVLKPPSPPQTEPKPNAPPKPKEEPGPRVESKPFTDADLEPILADLKGADRRKRKGALGRLPTAALGARRAEVAQALEPILAENDFFTRKACLQALGNWGTRDNVPAMLKFLDDPSPFIRWETMSALAKLQDERAIEPIAKHLVNFHDRGKASQALQTLGAQAEKTVVFYLKHNDWGVRLEACKILKLIGTRQSKAPLEEAARDSNGLVANEAKNAVQVVSARP
jgi:hypothetical protein